MTWFYAHIYLILTQIFKKPDSSLSWTECTTSKSDLMEKIRPSEERRKYNVGCSDS